jgi:serine/threonine protein kinase
VKPVHPGDLLDHYRIEGPVACGGMAAVFRGTDLRSGEPVAIKVPHPQAECDPIFFDRCRREAEIGREMEHPAVTRVLPDHDQSRVYMAMEWVEGRLLRQVLADQGPLSPERATRIAIGICEALEYLHARGVVHRDLKPENVMIGADDRIKLIDFGIAAKAGARRLTFGKLSHVMGTAEYISPEQVKGGRGDARSDIYAVGVILYEMLTGKTPFRGDNPLAVMNARLVSDPIPLRQIDPQAPQALEEILFRALEYDPGRRYWSAHEFANDLEHPDQIRPMPRARRGQEPRSKQVLFYSALAMIPATIFMLLLYVASRH